MTALCTMPSALRQPRHSKAFSSFGFSSFWSKCMSRSRRSTVLARLSSSWRRAHLEPRPAFIVELHHKRSHQAGLMVLKAGAQDLCCRSNAIRITKRNIFTPARSTTSGRPRIAVSSTGAVDNRPPLVAPGEVVKACGTTGDFGEEEGHCVIFATN